MAISGLDVEKCTYVHDASFGRDITVIATQMVLKKHGEFFHVPFMEARELLFRHIAGSVSIYMDLQMAGRYDEGAHGTSKNAEPFQRLQAFKAYQELWASRKHEGTPEKNWGKMQDEMAQWFIDNGMATLV